MLILVTYDVNTETESVARLCERYGHRVQNSVFECLLDAAQYVVVKSELAAVIYTEADSLRFYRLGNHYKSQVETIGKSPEWSQDDILLL